MLHFRERERDGETDKLRKVQYIMKHFSEQFRFHYMPKKEVSIDESLLDLEGHAPAIHYMPDKHQHCFGFKLFCLCESDTGYTLQCHLLKHHYTKATT